MVNTDDDVHNDERWSSLPRLVTSADLARHLGVTRSAVTNWCVRHPAEIPQPFALTSGNDNPLWRVEQLAEWDEWRLDRNAGARRVHEQLVEARAEVERLRARLAEVDQEDRR
jgi:hypothetical protein